MNGILGNDALMGLVKLAFIAGIDFFLFWRFAVPRVEKYADKKYPEHDYLTHNAEANKHARIRGAFGFMNAAIMFLVMWIICFR